MPNDSSQRLSFPAVSSRKVTAAFDGGRISSDGGVMLLAAAERRLGVATRLAGVIPDRRDPARIMHSMADIVRARILAIACGYEDADDLDSLRGDPAFKLACGRLPDSGADLCSQPTCSRLESEMTRRGVTIRAWKSALSPPPVDPSLMASRTVSWGARTWCRIWALALAV